MAGESLDPNKRTMAWRAETVLERVEGCRVMLSVHGFLTEAENERVKRRIAKWAKAAEAAKGEE